MKLKGKQESKRESVRKQSNLREKKSLGREN